MKLSRILSFILVLALCISTLTSCFVMTGDDNGNNNNQAPELVPSEGLEYDLINEEAEYAVVGMGVCQDAKVVVPEEHEGKPVTEIADSAFEGNEMIVEVVLPTSILKVVICPRCSKCTTGKSTKTQVWQAKLQARSIQTDRAFDNPNMPLRLSQRTKRQGSHQSQERPRC